MDVGKDTTRSDGHFSQELVEFLVITDSELNVAGDDTRFLVVTSSVTRKLEHLSGEILKDGGEVNRGACTNSLRVFSALQETSDTADRKLQAGLGGPRGRLLRVSTATFSLSGHGIRS